MAKTPTSTPEGDGKTAWTTAAAAPDAPTTQPQTDIEKAQVPHPMYQYRWAHEEHATRVLQALLMNPQIERFVGGEPFRRGPCGDFPSVGAALAEGAYRLATDYNARLQSLLDRDFPLNALTPVAEVAAGALVAAQGV